MAGWSYSDKEGFGYHISSGTFLCRSTHSYSYTFFPLWCSQICSLWLFLPHNQIPISLQALALVKVDCRGLIIAPRYEDVIGIRSWLGSCWLKLISDTDRIYRTPVARFVSFAQTWS